MWQATNQKTDYAVFFIKLLALVVVSIAASVVVLGK